MITTSTRFRLSGLPTAIAGIVGCVVFCAGDARAQAFLPAAGEGSLAITYQNLFARGHLDLNGDRMTGPSGSDPTQAHSMILEADIGVTEWVAVNVALPYIRSKYGGSTPHLVGGSGPVQEWDDGSYHGTFQDFRVAARFRLLRRPVAITPFVAAIVPSHHYPSTAHAAVGKDLRALVVGGAAGGFLDSIVPGLFFQAQVSHAVTQEVLDIRPNRTHVDAEVGFFITPRLSVSFVENYQRTHHGLDLISFNDPMTVAHIHDHPEIPITGIHRRNHDRLQRSNFVNLGGGIAYALTDTVQIFAASAHTMWGENVHPMRALNIGMNVQFSTRRGAIPAGSASSLHRSAFPME